ncbi:MAG TPA: hypothetical protein VJ761_03850 [Ktedonobacteraceae bacterium]|nr:hypothetical protein [Ktedonobacteraceae bacterium]
MSERTFYALFRQLVEADRANDHTKSLVLAEQAAERFPGRTK